MLFLFASYFLICPVLIATDISNGPRQPPAFSSETELLFVFDYAIDRTFLREPLLEYSELYGLREDFEMSSYVRRLRRYMTAHAAEFQCDDCFCIYEIPVEYNPEQGHQHSLFMTFLERITARESYFQCGLADEGFERPVDLNPLKYDVKRWEELSRPTKVDNVDTIEGDSPDAVRKWKPAE